MNQNQVDRSVLVEWKTLGRVLLIEHMLDIDVSVMVEIVVLKNGPLKILIRATDVVVVVALLGLDMEIYLIPMDTVIQIVVSATIHPLVPPDREDMNQDDHVVEARLASVTDITMSYQIALIPEHGIIHRGCLPMVIQGTGLLLDVGAPVNLLTMGQVNINLPEMILRAHQEQSAQWMMTNTIPTSNHQGGPA